MTTTAMPAAGEATAVIGGVNTHADTQTAAALDDHGCLWGTATFAATAAGSAALTT